jgi:hypothetical protein
MFTGARRARIRRAVSALIPRRLRSRGAWRVATAATSASPRPLRRLVHASERTLLGTAISAGLLLVERRLTRTRDHRAETPRD